METIHGIEKLIAAGLITVLVLFTPILFILFDLWAGIRKAKERNELITSYGLRRTVSKIARYYNLLFALLVIDSIQMAGLWFLDAYHDHNFPVFPFITLLGAIGVGAIEVRSIFEKAEDKVKRQASDVALLAGELAKCKSDPAELAKAVVEFMNKDKEEKK